MFFRLLSHSAQMLHTVLHNTSSSRRSESGCMLLGPVPVPAGSRLELYFYSLPRLPAVHAAACCDALLLSGCRIPLVLLLLYTVLVNVRVIAKSQNTNRWYQLLLSSQTYYI
eukprot:SAG25_NODE_1601_length_2694_cov_21.238536_3_plen_112_part_00